MKIRIISLTVLIAAGLAACVEAPTDVGATEIPVFHVLTDEGQASGELIRYEAVDVSGSALAAAAEGLNSPPKSPELRRALPDDVRILSVRLESEIAIVDLSSEYMTLSSLEKTLVNCCIALTFCSLEDVDSVTICVGLITVCESLSEENIMLYDTETIPYEKRLRLYFPDSSSGLLRAEYHTLTIDADTPIERYMIEELLRGPYDASLYSAIPAGTELLSITIEDDLCTVDLSSEFSSNRSENAIEALLAVYSIVNSITSLSEVDSVLLKVEGVPLKSYQTVNLSLPLTRLESLIG